MEEDQAAHTPTATEPKHLRRGKEAYPCKVCGESFSRAWSLVQHLWKHTGERPFKCRHCRCGFNALSSLRQHQRMKHNVKVVKLEEQKLLPNTEESQFKCDICGCSYKTRHILRRHRHRKHLLVETFIPNVDEEPLKSDQCGNSDKADNDLCEYQLMKHQQVKYEEEERAVMVKETPHELLPNTEEQPFQCDQSDDSFTTNSSFKKKKKSWAKTGVGINIACEVCGERFPNMTRRLVHQRLHEGKAIQKCTVCGAEFIWESQLRAHEKMHTKERPFECDDCGQRFSTTGNANVHKRTCLKNSIYFMCAHCGCTFTTRRELTIHQVQSLHIGKDIPLKKPEKTSDTGTDYDGDQFAEAPSVRKRIKQEHEGKKFHKCRYCGKNEHSNSSLLVHERVHTGERPFGCAYCNLASASLSNLRIHQLRRHPGQKLAALKRVPSPIASKTPDLNKPAEDKTLQEVVNKPFKCEYCEKAFRKRYHLQEHTYIHTGKPYNCDLCGCGFVRANRLKQHQFHCGVSVFRCRPCRCTFGNLDGLLEHNLLCHGDDEALYESDEIGDKRADKPHKCGCDRCGRRFSDASGLAIHKCDDQSTEKTLTCKDCGTVVQVGGTTLSNVFTVTDLSNVKCFRKNHTLF